MHIPVAKLFIHINKLTKIENFFSEVKTKLHVHGELIGNARSLSGFHNNQSDVISPIRSFWLRFICNSEKEHFKCHIQLHLISI